MRVTGIGEILWDELPSGRVLGGAPFNVTAHLARLGHHTAYLTAVGDDQPGQAAVAEARARGIDTALIQVTRTAPTGTARVTAGASGATTFQIARPAAFENIRAGRATLRRIAEQRPDALVFGTLAQRQPQVLDATGQVAAALPGTLRLYDVNLRDGWWTPGLITRLIQLATVVKFAEDEARQLSPLLGLTWRGAPDFCRALAARAGLRAVAVSAGSGTAALWLDGQAAQAPPPAITVQDTVGAGDAFSAGLLDGISKGLTAAVALRHANALGALIAARPGALPAWTPTDLAQIEHRSAESTGLSPAVADPGS
jgi:fructokinase